MTVIRLSLLLPVTVVLLAGAPGPVAAQRTPDAVAAAERLGEGGRYGEAADTLLGYLRSHPRDAGVRWRAAQLLHRAGRTDAALRQYEAAVTLMPSEPWLRLEYADLLAALGSFDRARLVALPVAGSRDASDEARVRALTLLGTLAYWRGDLTAAVRRFEAALALDPEQDEAARQLREIRAITRPWTRLSVTGLDDNQPYRRGRAELEAGVYLSPLWTAAVEVVPRVLDPSSPPGGTSSPSPTRTAGEARTVVKGFLPAASLDVTAGLGGVLQDGPGSTWGGHAGLGIRLPGGLGVTGRAERERYLWTTASADTLLMVESVELSLGRPEHPGWAGEAVVRHESFPDGNSVGTAYAWLLAPVAPGVRLGWAASWQDAEETRWDPGAERYAPYYTPERQRSTSALAALTLPLGDATVRLDGSRGVWAREDAPISTPSGPGTAPGQQPGVVFFERSYTPWRVQATLEVPAGERATVRVEAERRETAFYALTRGSVELLVQLGDLRAP